MKKDNTSDVLIANLNMLLDSSGMTKTELSKRSKISLRMIHFILSKEKNPTIDKVDALASAFNLKGWELFLPNLKLELVRNGCLEKLIDLYSKSSPAGREYINRVAEQEAKYGEDDKKAS